jgi:hypothetical protein
MKRYIVETEMLGTWENCWTGGDELLGNDDMPRTFTEIDAAVDDIRDHITDCINAAEATHMDDSPDATEFRIIEETDSGNGWEVTGIFYCTNPAAFTYEATA